jgi:hypothetical protein
VESATVLAVYRVSPWLLVVEAEDSPMEWSLRKLHDGGHRLSAVVRSPDHKLVRRRARAR